MGLKLNLGCGLQYLPGYVNCDVLAHIKADSRFDLNSMPYPFESESADEILMDNVLEHLDDIPRVMEELHRILRNGGLLRLLVPYAKTDWAVQDPTHKHFFTERSMQYFSGEGRYGYYGRGCFTILRADLVADGTTWRHAVRNAVPFRKLLRFFLFNMYDSVYFELRKDGGLSQRAGVGPL